MAQYQLFSRTKNNINVYVQSKRSHAVTHFVENPPLLDLVKAALPRINASGENVQTAYDFGKYVGRSDLVATTERDEILYAKRPHRKAYARFVKHRRPVKTSHITIVLQEINVGYLLISAWIGPSVPPFPGDRREWPDSKAFWEHHALVYGRQSIDEPSITDLCPWQT